MNKSEPLPPKQECIAWLPPFLSCLKIDDSKLISSSTATLDNHIASQLTTLPRTFSSRQLLNIMSSSPSAARRQALKAAEEQNKPRAMVSNDFPLSKYMDIAPRLLECFQNAVDQRQLDEAYIYGLRFAGLVVEGLPQHKEWRQSPVDARRKQKLNAQVTKVLAMMEVIVQRMDAEELVQERKQKEAKGAAEAAERAKQAVKKERVDLQRQREKEQRAALEEERQKFLAEQKKKVSETQKKNVEQSAMAKLFALNAISKSKPKATSPKETNHKKSSEAVSGNGDAAVSKPGTSIGSGPKKPMGKLSAVASRSTSRSDPLKTTSSSQSAKDLRIQKSQKKLKTKQPAVQDEFNIGTAKKIEQPTHRNQALHSQATEECLANLPAKQGKKENKSPIAIVPSSGSETKDLLESDETQKDQERRAPSIKPKISASNGSERKVATVVSEKRPGEIETQLRDGLHSADGDPTRPAILSPLSTKEQRTIDLLEQNIKAQEHRLEDIEETQIPYLLSTAKTLLKENNKKEALKCVAHKKRLERQVDVIKGSIFNMETQMFMLENAMEDRHVKKALDEAAAAISGLQTAIGDPNATLVDLTSMNLSLQTASFIDETDEELMEELEVWVSPDKRVKMKYNGEDSESILSLPSVPSTTPLPEGSVQTILSAVIGS